MKWSYIMKVYSIEKADYWRKKIEEHKNSGFSMSHFCQKNNLSLDSFKYWKYRFRNADNAELTETHKSSTLSLIRESSSDNGRFLPVCIRDRSLTSVNPVFNPESSSSSSGLSIHIGQTGVLKIEENFNSQVLFRVLEVIAQI